MSIASWLAGAPRRIKAAFAALISLGKRSEKRAAKLVRIVENAGASEFKPVKGSKGARYFLPSAPKTAPTISRTEYIKRTHGGTGPKELAAQRKAGTRGYLSPATQEQAAKQRVTKALSTERRSRRERIAEQKGFARGRNRSRAVHEYLEQRLAQHERYLQTGRLRDRIDEDEYRKVVHLAHEYGIDEDRIERLKMSYSITAQAA
jgi:hypothetical protein